MLLITEALLLILAALGQDHRAAAAAVEGQIFPLDMALNSVDDQYMGCRDEMAKRVETELLKEELSNLNIFKTAWEKAEKTVKTPKKGLKENHEIAIYVYSDTLVFDEFNSATRRDKKQYEHKTYEWYSLYFLLTDAIQILNNLNTQTNKPNKCCTTYRGTKVEFDKDVLNKEVRFGSFASSSLDRKVAQRHYGTKSCFEIYTCEGADVTEYSKLRHEKEVLIPPYEKFKVTAVKTRRDQKDLWCETVFVLKSSGIRSDLNCALFRKITKTKRKY